MRERLVNQKCWLCKMSTHWMDQCPNFTSMSPSDCVKVVKEDHSCFYFLKRAGFQLLRRCQCSESFQGNQCKYFHHPLIHIANAKNSASTLTVSADDQFFPSHWKSWDQETKKKQGNLFLDSDAQVSLITL